MRYLANRDDHVHFALVTDFQDAHEETMPGDAALLRLAKEGIEALNVKYKGDRGDRFFLFHRPRRWDAHERVWMGYERKRGKLAALNSLLRGSPGDRFSLIVGETSVLPSVRYVITLDTDTQLPRDVAQQLVGAIAHPLNRARFDQRVAARLRRVRHSPAARGGEHAGGRPVRGFCDSSGASRAWTRTRAPSRTCTRMPSAKGRSSERAFTTSMRSFESLGDQFPENLILSHDLLEGCYARSALVSDVQLYESSPQRYLADVSRRHRWVRGDWQISPWLLPRVPGPAGRRLDNPISALSRWKIFDNLRRSLVAPSLVLVLIAGWCVLEPALVLDSRRGRDQLVPAAVAVR